MERPWDIIDELTQTVGKVRSVGSARPGEEGYYGEYYRAANKGAGREAFSSRGQSPDSALDALRRSGHLGSDASVDDLWDAIERAASVRKASRRYDDPMRQADRFTKALAKREKAKCKKRIPTSKLRVGSKFTLDGSEFKVQDIDPDTLEVDVVDGARFGRQLIPDGAVIPADKTCAPAKARQKAPRPAAGDLRYLIRRRKPARKRPVNYVGIRIGAKVRVLEVLGSSLRAVGTFTRERLKAWAEKAGVRLRGK